MSIDSEERELTGESAEVRRLRADLRMLATSSAPVLLEGETGTGKDVAAEVLHRLSRRPRFVRVDCAAIQDSLVASELFGHSKGAFTGASESTTGLIPLADGGTLFLDEIGELTLLQQKRLLTVLSSGEIRPIGSTRSRTVSFRLIAATNRNLKEEVAQGRFRQDLYYRVNVVKVRVPPLRDRREDIPALTRHFLRQFRADLSIADEDIERLQCYSWPGNVRQLQACVQRLAVFAAGETVSLGHAPLTVLWGLSEQHGGSPLSAPGYHNGAGPDLGDREVLTSTLDRCGNNRKLAARELGIGRSTLYRRLRRTGLS